MPPVELALSVASMTAEALVSAQALLAVACRYRTPLAVAGAEQRLVQARAFVQTAKRQVPARPAAWVADGLRSTQAQVETQWLLVPRSCLPKGGPVR
jgi:hypothetical protein